MMIHMTYESMMAFAESWIAAWNRRDVEAVLAHYDFPPAHSRSLMASVAGPTRSSIVRARRGAPDGRGGRSPGLEQLISRCSLIRPLRPWTRTGSLRFPGDPSH